MDKNFIILIFQHFQILESCSYTCHPLWHNKILCLQSLSKWMWNHWYLFFFEVQLNVKTQHCESTIVVLLQNQRNCSQFAVVLLNVTYKVCQFIRGSWSITQWFILLRNHTNCQHSHILGTTYHWYEMLQPTLTHHHELHQMSKNWL